MSSHIAIGENLRDKRQIDLWIDCFDYPSNFMVYYLIGLITLSFFPALFHFNITFSTKDKVVANYSNENWKLKLKDSTDAGSGEDKTLKVAG